MLTHEFQRKCSSEWTVKLGLCSALTFVVQVNDDGQDSVTIRRRPRQLVLLRPLSVRQFF